LFSHFVDNDPDSVQEQSAGGKSLARRTESMNIVSLLSNPYFGNELHPPSLIAGDLASNLFSYASPCTDG
jgi:hypothetical protein